MFKIFVIYNFSHFSRVYVILDYCQNQMSLFNYN